MFRYARAQRGRYREHWQFGVEALGSDDAAVDAEVVALQAAWYRRLGLDGVELRLNSIGDTDCRPAYREQLVAYLRAHAEDLSADSRERLDVNPLRVFDSKDPRDHEVLREAPRISQHLCDACRAHFDQVRAFLDARALPYTLDSALVRGLDYYERTTWEFVWEPLGAQSALGGGGRYDGLAEQLGGARTPGVGFGAGLERTVLAMEAQGAVPPPPACDWYCAIDEPAARPGLHAQLDLARARGIAAEADLAGRSLKGQLRQAGRLHARLVTVCTAADWARGIVTAHGEELAVDGLVDEVERRLRA
jgi:histidyl-tRNA synthetase